MEELWAFNEEIVAISIYNSQIPIISAVGHETDFTIADFAADMRAETPTAAANAAVPDMQTVRENLQYHMEEIKRNLRMVAEDRRKYLEMLNIGSFGRDIQSRIVMEQLKADNLIQSIQDSLNNKIAKYCSSLKILKETLETSNPKAILTKGYSVVTDENGVIVKDMTALKKNQLIKIEGAVGEAFASVTKKQGKR